ncbi:Histone-lysine N-methyltransferase protein [Dioscorea alata]|uniref:Histone-lysine N-methyltransferase protein n=1 Tax=Dioscorea alata TaxID=55571 RepID=A0ACB7UP24_DIOAL|nr:Histone-lysine N-methyltransferase protein [Dioscorea alata]
MKLLSVTAQLWNLFDKWEIRLLVLVSLFLQIVLIFSADHRKRNVSRPLNIVLWLAYLLADSVAIFALGVLTHSQDDDSSPSPSPSPSPAPAAENEFSLQAFWSPFLLLHLGGPDTITAFSLEDNELWRRHLLNLLFQVSTAFYVFYKSLFLSTTWLLPSLFMFATGLLKYGERTWALFSASMDSFRSSLLTPPDPGPNYAKFMEEYASSRSAGLHAEITVEAERRPKSITPDDTQEEQSQNSPEVIVQWAYCFFLTFRRLIVDLILTFEDRINSQAFFLRGLSAKEAFKVVEIELSFIYDVLHTKSAVIHTTIGRLIRITTFIYTIIALLLFFLVDKHKYNPADVRVTYTLAIGALVLEIYAMFYAVVSFWTFNWLYFSKCTSLSSFVFRLSDVFGMYSKPSWSDSMAGYNLLSFCYKDQFRVTIGKILCFFGLKDTLDQFFYTKHKPVPEYLKRVIFRELKLKTGSIIDTASYKRFSACRGEWALRQKGYYKELGWSVEVEFDECVLLWHIATDLCSFKEAENDTRGDAAPQSHEEVIYNIENDARDDTAPQSHEEVIYNIENDARDDAAPQSHDHEEDINNTENNTRDDAAPQSHEEGINNTENNTRDAAPQSLKEVINISKVVSNYLLYLLLERPFMLTAGIGQIRYGDTCAEVKHFFQRWGKEKSIEDVCKRLLKVSTEYSPIAVKGDRSKSVLFDACRLAKELMKIEEKKTRWEVISLVLVEMLCFAATKCRGNFHAKQLSNGGELLTHVWILMAHMGIGEQYRIEAGHARAKLFVAK